MSNLVLAVVLLTMIACTKDSLPEKKFTLSDNNIQIKWTAYKFSKKLGVEGQFEEFLIEGVKYNTSIKDMMSDVTIEIATESINTQSTFRDNNILNYFFKRLDNYQHIKAQVVKVQGRETEGKLITAVEFNGTTQELEFDYRVSGQRLLLAADLNLSLWDASKSLVHFEDCCSEYHTGEDGIQVVWPDVSIDILIGLAQTN